MNTLQTPSDTFDLGQLLHPARAFDHPRDVVGDPDPTPKEKRTVLASWGSDACAVEAAPALRYPPGARQALSVDEILEALRVLDQQANREAARGRPRAKCGAIP
jgi:hypothetical protein